MKRIILLVLFGVYTAICEVSAQIPPLIHYQGRVVAGGTNLSGPGQFKFALIGTNQAGAAVTLWSNDGSGATRGEPAAAVTLPVDNGLFAVLLGDAALPNMRAIPATVFTNSDVRLRVWFSEGAGVFEALAPDQRIAAVGYAMMAAAAVTVVDGTVSNAKLAPGAVTGDKLAPGAVSAEHLVSGQVVKSLNSLKDDVMLVAGANITLSTNGNALQIAAGGGATNAAGWSLTGNSGVAGGFLGTLDNQPLEIKVGNSRVWRFEPTWTGTGPLRQSAAANSVGGYRGNLASNGVMGAFIGGGGASSVLSSMLNTVGGDFSVVGGGAANTAGGKYAAVVGGAYNRANGDYSLAAGRRAQADHAGAFVWADSQNSDFAATGTDQFLIRARGGVGIGTANPLATLDIAVIAGAGGLHVSGSRGGNYTTPLSFLENTNATGNTGPALRLLAKGNAVDGVLNVGSTGTGKLLVLGNDRGETASFDLNGNLSTKGGIVLDSDSVNNAALSPALVFGANSGEVIASKRTRGGNQWGLDFYTASQPRLSIDKNGRVGIGTTAPQGVLEVVTDTGSVQIISDQAAPGINLANGPNPGVLRLRNALEVWPSQDATRAGRLDVRGTNGDAAITLSGTGQATVKILEITGGADIAEPFPLSENDLPPGSVVVIDEDHPGQLKLSGLAYDTRVAGVISGANGIHPGISLCQNGVLDRGQKVALSGRVYVRADAAGGAIKPGDLLTTSATPGHAMKVTDHPQAQGAILGKAMGALRQGRGLVLVLVTLQ